MLCDVQCMLRSVRSVGYVLCYVMSMVTMAMAVLVVALMVSISADSGDCDDVTRDDDADGGGWFVVLSHMLPSSCL